IIQSTALTPAILLISTSATEDLISNGNSLTMEPLRIRKPICVSTTLIAAYPMATRSICGVVMLKARNNGLSSL
ncbi:hypothetical protein BGW38_008115, partial [Lunasporangiospora selenospora]